MLVFVPAVPGWVTDPYMGNAEFYMDYADYDVNISVPQGWLIGATGELINATEVLSKQTRDRLADSKRGGDVVHVLTWEGAGATPADDDARQSTQHRDYGSRGCG